MKVLNGGYGSKMSYQEGDTEKQKEQTCFWMD